MGKNYMIINGVHSQTFPNLLIEELPSLQLPEKKVEIIEVEGRSGALTITDDSYLNLKKSCTCKLITSKNVDEIAMWLADCQSIVFSNKPDRFYKARYTGQIDFERHIFQNRAFTCVFDCEPFGYLVSNAKVTTSSNNFNFRGSGTHWSEPIITVYGSGNINLRVNGQQITLKDVSGHITVNTQKKRTYKDFTLLNNKKIGGFPTLKHTDNSVSWDGTVSRVEIIPNWRCLI